MLDRTSLLLNWMPPALAAVGLLSTPVFAQVAVVDGGPPSQIVEVDTMTGAGTQLSLLQAYSAIADLAPEGSGDLLVLYATPIPAVVRVEPMTGSQLVLAVSDPMAPLGLTTPTRIARGSGGHVVVFDQDAATPRLLDLDPLSGALTLRPVVATLGTVVDIGIDAAGDVIVLDGSPPAGPGGSALVRIDQTTGVGTTISSGGFLTSAAMSRLAIDGNDLYVLLDAPTSRVVHVDLATGAQRLVSSGGYLSAGMGGLEVADGDPVVLTSGPSSSLVRIDSASGLQTPIASGGFLGVPGPLATVDGSIYAGTSGAAGPGSPSLVEVVLASGAQRGVPAVNLGMTPTDMAAGSDELFLTSMGSILGVDPAGGATRLVASEGFLTSALDIAIDPVRGNLYTTGLLGAGGGILRIDPLLGSQLPIAVGGLLTSLAMNGLDVNDAGEIFLLAAVVPSISVVRVDPSNGSQTLLPNGPFLTSPTDLTLGPDGDLFLIDGLANAGAVGVVRKNPTTGVETLIPTGPFAMDFPTRIDATDDAVYLLTSSPDPNNKVMELDVDTGALTPLPASGLIQFGNDLAAIPVPEPASTLGLAAGAALLWRLGRRRQA